MVCLLKVSPCSATSFSGTFPVEYPARLAFPYRGLWLPPETTKGSGHCEGGWCGGSSWWLCLLRKKLAHNCHSCVSSASAEGPHDIASTVPSPPSISDTAFSLGNCDCCQMLSDHLQADVSETFCSQVMSDQSLGWHEVELCHWFLEKLCLVVSADDPHLWLLLVLSFPLPHSLNQKSFKGQSSSSTPCSVGSANPYLPL